MAGIDLFAAPAQPTMQQTNLTVPQEGGAGAVDLFGAATQQAQAPTQGGISVPSGLSLDITQQPQQQFDPGDFLSTALEGYKPIQDSDWGQAIQEVGGNIVPSAQGVAKDTLSGLMDPLGTVTQLGGIVTGGLQEMIPGMKGIMPEGRSKEAEEMFDLFTSVMKDEYGSVENFKKTAKNDPVKVLADMGTFFVPGGKAVKGLGKASKFKTLERLGGAIASGSAALEPVNIAKRGVGALGGLIPKGIPSKLYESGLNLSAKLTKQQRANLIKTGLTEGVMPTIKGLDNIRDRINVLNVEIADLIDRAATTGERIPVELLGKGITKLKQQARELRFGDKDAALTAINNVKKEILGLSRGGTIDPRKAQRVKQNIYKANKNAYEAFTQSPANVEAKKMFAHNLKESLETLFPEFDELRKTNKRDSDLISLEKEIIKSVDSLRMADLVNSRSPVAITMGLLNRPAMKAKLGIVIDKLRRTGTFVDPQGLFSKAALAPVMGGGLGAVTRGAAALPSRLETDLGGEEAQ